jgi:Zn-dependent protease/CBS domain-containing protein
MGRRSNFQLARIFGIRVGVSGSWFVVLFAMIYVLSEYFHEILGGSQSTAYVVAVGGALGYFASLILHELGHALVARRLGIPIAGIDLWLFGGLSTMSREPESPGQEFKIAAAGPAVTLALCGLFIGLGTLIASGTRVTNVAALEGVAATPALALIGWLAFINAALFIFNIVPAFPLDGGRIARAIVWKTTGDRNRATQATGRSGQVFALAVGLFGLWEFSRTGAFFGLFTMMLAYVMYQSAGAAVVQGALGRRIQHVTVADIMDREPVTIGEDVTLLDAREQFFLRYHLPWFAVVDPTRHFLGVVRQQLVESEIAAGRPALTVGEVLEQDLPVRVEEQTPLESLLRSEGIGRLGAMVAVDSDGVLQGVVTLAQISQALRPARPARVA